MLCLIIYKHKSNRKTIKICENQHADLLRFFFTEGSLKMKKDLELVSRPFFIEFFDKNFSFTILHKLVKFHYHTTSQVIY